MIKTTVKSRFLGRYPAVNQAEFAEKIGRNPPDQLALSKPRSAHGGPAFLTRVVMPVADYGHLPRRCRTNLLNGINAHSKMMLSR